ncbi:MAG: TonB-dependent receptor [Bacteroidales bacterium]|nr:TonB-dependent receptor [Bacteroidales bacterium]
MKKLLFIIIFIPVVSIAQTGSLKGKVFDQSNNEAIPFANILIKGTSIGTTSDLDGNFIITGIPLGYKKVEVSFLGYQTKLSQDVLISRSKTPFIEIGLAPQESLINEVVVKADVFEKIEEAPIAMQTIGTKEIESNPGSNRDISRVIQSFPGVGSTPAFRNDVIIRGGGPSENRFFLDGIEIPVLNHFSTQGASGGPVGIINADFIQSVNFYSGSFPASKYNALSGMLDFYLKEGNKDKTNIQFSLGASETAITLDGPLGEKTSYIFSARRSYLQFLFSAIGLPFLPTFNDYQLKLKTNFNAKNQLTIISLGSYDQLKLNTGIENPDASQEYILSQIPVNNQWSYTIGGVYKHFFEKGYHTLVLSRNMLNNEFYKYPDNDETRNKSFDYLSQEIENKFRYEYNLRKSGYKYVLSSQVEYAKYNNKTRQEIYLNQNLNILDYSTDMGFFKYGISGQITKKFINNALLLSLGIKMDGNNYNKKMSNILQQSSPRFSASYSITEQYIVNAGIGRYFQLPAYTTLGFSDNYGNFVNENTADYIGANHYNLGIDFKPSEKALFSLEGFYKDYFQYPIDLKTGSSLANQGADYSSVAGATEVDFSGIGKALGFEILHRLNLTKLNILASYTYVRSVFTNLDNEWVPSSWDSRHIFSLTGTKDFNKHWRVGFKWRYVGGLPYTPYDLQTSSIITAWDANGQPYYDYSQLNSERFKDFHQLDVRIDKNFFFKKWSLMLYFDVQNAYNFQNQGQDYVIREKNPDGTYKTTNNGTNYVLKTLPNYSGTVLPTIGIIIKL